MSCFWLKNGIFSSFHRSFSSLNSLFKDENLLIFSLKINSSQFIEPPNNGSNVNNGLITPIILIIPIISYAVGQ